MAFTLNLWIALFLDFWSTSSSPRESQAASGLDIWIAKGVCHNALRAVHIKVLARAYHVACACIYYKSCILCGPSPFSLHWILPEYIIVKVATSLLLSFVLQSHAYLTRLLPCSSSTAHLWAAAPKIAGIVVVNPYCTITVMNFDFYSFVINIKWWYNIRR